ncbi:hypothetical protein FH972_010030 [Carpinus fangiana]|uniref:Glutamyl-tRNA reductase N-terminal domain-containing protein n=1 Tax=Carpinus fangiana TaxID=176857 RepID=A0A660KM22_9ROSI|nr:hypothetical protein FH972_010030 [Carpinus fangiana]
MSYIFFFFSTTTCKSRSLSAKIISGRHALSLRKYSGRHILSIAVDLLSSGYTKERSSIVVIGLSVHTTSVEMREKLAIPEAEWPRAIGELCSLNHIEEAAVLSTCNRMEIYLVALSQHRGVKEVTEWMSKEKAGFGIYFAISMMKSSRTGQTWLKSAHLHP